MINIYDSANQLASDIQKTEEYQDLSRAIAAVKSSPSSLNLFRQIDQLQAQMIAEQSAGRALSEDTQKKYQRLDTEAQQDLLIKDMLNKEQKVYQLIEDVQKAVTKPVADLYSDLRD